MNTASTYIPSFCTRGDIHHFECCIVGEAHGWDSGYTKSCDKCLDLANEFSARRLNLGVIRHMIDEFVTHFNEAHIK